MTACIRPLSLTQVVSIRSRIVSGTIANAAGIGMSAAAQIASVPALTFAWGVERYGLWLILTTVPAYLALSDLGFASAATSDMTMQVARGQRGKAIATFQSVWLLVNIVSLAIVLIAGAAILGLRHASTSFSWIEEQSAVLAVLVLYSAVVMNARIALAGLRATHNYALGTMLYQIMTLVEVTAILATALRGGNFIDCSLAMLGAQVLNAALMFVTLRRRVPWLALGFHSASMPELKRLWIPAAAAMAIPSALAVNLQGMVLVTGILVSTTAAATLSSVRTVSRVAIQVVGAINRATMPELSTAGAIDSRAAFGKIIALNLATVSIVLVPGAMLFAAFGDQVVEIWTRGKIVAPPSFVALIAIAAVAHGFWYYTSNLMLASNAHTAVTRLLVVTSMAAIFFAVPAAYVCGLFGIGGVLVLTEIVCLIGVLRVALRSGLFNPADFESALKLKFWRS